MPACSAGVHMLTRVERVGGEFDLTDSNTGLAMISSYTPGGWVGGSHLHNNATLWPNLQVRTGKNSSQVECGSLKKSLPNHRKKIDINI